METEISLDHRHGTFDIRIEGGPADERFVLTREQLQDLQYAIDLALADDYVYLVDGKVF